MATSGLTVTKIWPLEKYARFIPDEQSQVLPSARRDAPAAKRGGDWKHHQSTRDCRIQLTVLEPNHLMITSGTQIYESFSLWNGQKWIKGVSKGDSILFIYKLNDQNRRFRIKFAQTSSVSSTESCRNFVTSLAPLLPIREMDSGPVHSVPDSQLPSGSEDSQMMSMSSQQVFAVQEATNEPTPLTELALMSQQSQHVRTSGEQVQQTSYLREPPVNVQRPLPDVEDDRASSNNLMSVPSIAKSVMEGKPLGLAYACTNFPTEQLGAFIRLCLTDSNFPGFVEAVEKEMNSIKN